MEITEMTFENLELQMAFDRMINPDYPVSKSVISSLKLYVEKGIMPGGFLTSVLENDLMGAMARADSYNRATIFQITCYVHNEIPSDCHGSPEIVESWQKRFSDE